MTRGWRWKNFICWIFMENTHGPPGKIPWYTDGYPLGALRDAATPHPVAGGVRILRLRPKYRSAAPRWTRGAPAGRHLCPGKSLGSPEDFPRNRNGELRQHLRLTVKLPPEFRSATSSTTSVSKAEPLRHLNNTRQYIYVSEHTTFD